MFAVPFGEWFEELKTVRGRRDLDGNGGTIEGRRLECVLTRVVTARREFEAGRRGEFKGGAGGSWEGVCEWVEGKRTGEGECSDDVG